MDEEENQHKKKKEQQEQQKLPPQKRKRIRTKKGSELYIDSKEMMQELVHYNNTLKYDEDGEPIEHSGEITEKLGEMFLKLARRYTSKPNFVGYSFRDEMISESVYRMISQIDKFDVHHPSKNPFAYFTQICYHQVLTMINKEKRQTEIKDNIRAKLWDEVCEEEQIAKYEEPDTDA